MKRLTAICALLCSILLIVASTVQCAHASGQITGTNWLGTLANHSYDSFYGMPVTGYEENTAATLIVNFYNNYPYAQQVNVSALKVGFDWGQNYSSNEASIDAPFVVRYRESHAFTITFTLPNASSVSNLVTHSYTIYEEDVNSTTGAKALVDEQQEYGSAFVIFSSDQADAYLAKEELAAYPAMSLPFFTANARELLTESSIAESLADTEYSAGSFANAKTDYQNALLLMQDAYANETDRWGSFENTFEGLLSGAQSLVVNQGYAWLLFGVALLLMGIGVIIYLVRKSGK